MMLDIVNQCWLDSVCLCGWVGIVWGSIKFLIQHHLFQAARRTHPGSSTAKSEGCRITHPPHPQLALYLKETNYYCHIQYTVYTYITVKCFSSQNTHFNRTVSHTRQEFDNPNVNIHYMVKSMWVPDHQCINRHSFGP